MKCLRQSLITILLISGFVGSLNAYNDATHIYLGSQTFDIWENLDPEFRDSLNSDSSYGIWVRKYYYIGLTLPDLFWEKGIFGSQRVIRGLINALHSEREYFTGPLYITDLTYNQVQTNIVFDGLAHHDIGKLRDMVDYAQSNNFSPLDKALIYGAYVHAIHDYFASQVSQPARFGYGFAVDSDSARSKSILDYAERHYEIFACTFINNWDFIIPIYIGWNMGPIEPGPVIGDLQFDFVAIWVGTDPQIHAGWQSYEVMMGDSISQVLKFVEAANAVGYAESGLTYYRLKSYMHGWAIGMFLSYGYRMPSVSDKGGIFGHPQWNFSQVRNYSEDIAQRWVAFPYSIFNILPTFIQDWLKPFVRNILGYASTDVLCEYNDPWPSFFESTQGLERLWYSVPPEDTLNDTLRQEYHGWHRNIEYWENYAVIKKPNLRISYADEIDKCLTLEDLYSASVDGGYELPNWTLSRKAGLLGGMFTVPDVTYALQPGVFDMHFEVGGDLRYTTLDVPVKGSPIYVDLCYDLITFGTTSVQFIGKKTNGSKFPLAHTSFSNTARQIGTLTINAQDAVSQGVRELSFDVLTKTSGKADYNLMFSSDCRDAYNSHQAIYTNPLYQDWFTDGVPVRTSGQNPLQDPKHYWPYVLKLKPVLGCPYVYAWNGEEFVEDNTILSASEGEEGTVVDFYKIETPLELKDVNYAIEIREFEQEHTHLDKLELLAVDHPAGINIGTTPDGQILAYKEILMPSSCIDNHGNNQLLLVENSGDGHFEGADGDWLTVNFGEVGSGDKAIILAKPPPKEASVGVQVNDGSDWKTVGTVYPRGKESISLVRLPENGSGNSLKVRLLCKGNARIDYVALANLVKGETKIKECALASAWHSNSKDIINELRRVDLGYAELVPGDTIRLEFKSAKQTNGWQRDFVLVSTGYYEHIEGTGGTMSAGSKVPLSAFRICGGYPNPFNSATQIKFAIPEEAQVNLGIHDVTGRLVKTLANKKMEAGYHTIAWEPEGLASGIYFVKLHTANYTEVKKLILMR